jgi:hypothetical protein
MFNWLRKKKIEPKNEPKNEPEIKTRYIYGDWRMAKWCHACKIGLKQKITLCPRCGSFMSDEPVVRARPKFYISCSGRKYCVAWELHLEDFKRLHPDSEPHIPKTDPPEPPPGRPDAVDN